MEELMQLRSLLEAGRMPEAMVLMAEMEEMGRKGLEHNIRRYMQVLLTHLIKQQAQNDYENKSCKRSIKNAVREILDLNQRDKGRGFYFRDEELKALLNKAYSGSLTWASDEAFGGALSEEELEEKINPEQLKADAFELVRSEQPSGGTFNIH